jgi:TrmH family RNA methyltransferase
MGTIIRTADAMGVDGVFLSKGCVDVYNPKVIRSAMGSLFHIPVIEGCDFNKLMLILSAKSICVTAAHLKGKMYPCDVDFRKSAAILIGNEANGLTDNVSAMADNLVKIPMKGKAESLNAAVACSIMLYEVTRQRME